MGKGGQGRINRGQKQRRLDRTKSGGAWRSGARWWRNQRKRERKERATRNKRIGNLIIFLTVVTIVAGLFYIKFFHSNN